MHTKIRKRDGRLVKFKAEKITSAIAKAGMATGEFDDKIARKMTIKVLNLANRLFDSMITWNMAAPGHQFKAPPKDFHSSVNLQIPTY